MAVPRWRVIFKNNEVIAKLTVCIINVRHGQLQKSNWIPAYAGMTTNTGGAAAMFDPVTPA